MNPVSDADRQELRKMFTTRHYENQNQVESTHAQLEYAPPSRNDKQGRERRQTGAANLHHARTQLRASMEDAYDNGTRILGHADFIIMWPDKCKVRPRIVPGDRQKQPNFRRKRPRFTACSMRQDMLKKEEGKQRMVELKLEVDTLAPRVWEDIKQNAPRSRYMRVGEWNDDDDDDDDDDFEDELDLQGDILAALQNQSRRFGSYVTKFACLCKTTVQLYAHLKNHSHALHSGRRMSEQEFQPLARMAMKEIWMILRWDIVRMRE